MEDLSSLSRSLHEILKAPQGGESLASTVEGYLTTAETSTKTAVCDILLELLAEGDEPSQTDKKQVILSDTSLTYLPLLLPLSTSIISSKELVCLIAEYSKAREVVLGLTEGIQSIVDRAEGYQVSDDEGDFEDEEIAVDWPGLIEEYELIIRCLNVAIPRLPNSRSTPTLLSLSESVSISLPILSHQATTISARILLKELCGLVNTIWVWVQNTSDKGGEQRAILFTMLFESITLLGYKVDAKLTERWFLNTFPKFKNMPTSQESLEGWEAGQEVLDLAWSTGQTLDFTPSDIVHKIIDPSHITVHSSLASLNLISSQLATQDIMTLIPSLVSPMLLDDSMPILCAALSGSSVDAGVAYTWAIVNYYSDSKEGTVEYDNASMLLELLVPLTAQHPSSLMRLALFKLIGGIISLQTSAVNKIELFKQLLEPANPFDNIRIQSLSLLRETISSKEVLSSVLVEILFPILFVSPSQQDLEDNPFTYSPSDLLNSPYIPWWTECLTLLWFILDFDKEDVTGARKRSEGDDGMRAWIGGIEKKLKELQVFLRDGNSEDNNEFGGADFMVMRFEDALNRVRRVTFTNA
ncbi:hypothetical protein I203_102809 [Kwoniella mangroviensis CBS 8507]|uniref:uncharacterized protein n=1 Tax=Kwoniella mangroviensis CBS 8507 TaxID=1296122 RepID=UPI00080CD3A0|nr:uncharacterized protein I203_03783 [Kwoniella mangroviensis CBS 8507]OCF67098.1 hypothetical protein I203_03783 [Kwoniella mangroviensis CBS 8507]